jgi:hypothetical protein
VKKLILILLLTISTQIYSQHLNSVGINLSIPYNTENKTVSCCMGFNTYIYNVYVSFDTNFKNIQENEYGKGYLTNEYIIQYLEVGYAIGLYRGYNTKGRNNIFITPCVGVRTYKQLYSDLYYDEYAYGNIINKLSIGCNILLQRNYITYSLLCSIGKIGFSIGMCF